MTNLWRNAAAAAIITGALTGCASPQYPISANQTPGSGALSAPQPKYPIAAPAPAAAVTPAPAANPAPDASQSAPIAAPVPKVDTQSLPPPTSAPPASQAGAPTSASASEGPPPSQTPPSPPPDPPLTNAPAPSTSAEPATPAPASVATTTPSSASAGAPAMPVTHDQPARPAPRADISMQPVTSMPNGRQAYAAPAPRRSSEGASVAGRVVDAGGDIFENYEVQRGDHIDALARSFNTSRDVLLEANHVRRPYVIHPGEIMKVPVAKAYVAESGDTLAEVARRFSVPAGELAELNHVSERATLREGERIGLPSSMRDRGPLRSSYSEYVAATPRPTYASSYVAPPAHPGLTPLYPSTQVSPDRGSAYAPPPSASAPIAAPPGLSDAEISAAAKGRFVWPVRGDILARFGPLGVGRRNDGVDIKAAQGVTVMAAAGGEVVYAGDQVPGFGNLVLIKHPDGWVTAYAHLDQVHVQMKDQVAQGQAVGTVGASGGVAEPELHFEVRYAPTPADKARPVDPVLVLPSG